MPPPPIMPPPLTEREMGLPSASTPDWKIASPLAVGDLFSVRCTPTTTTTTAASAATTSAANAMFRSRREARVTSEVAESQQVLVAVDLGRNVAPLQDVLGGLGNAPLEGRR